MKVHWMPSDLCSECGYAVDAASEVTGGTPRPSPGNLTVCLRCGAILEWDEAMLLRACPEATLKELDARTRRIVETARRHIKERGPEVLSAKGQERLVKKA